MILHFNYTRLTSAVGATVEGVLGFNAVPYDFAAAMVTDRG